jgi:hypothetical protein
MSPSSTRFTFSVRPAQRAHPTHDLGCGQGDQLSARADRSTAFKDTSTIGRMACVWLVPSAHLELSMRPGRAGGVEVSIADVHISMSPSVDHDVGRMGNSLHPVIIWVQICPEASTTG